MTAAHHPFAARDDGEAAVRAERGQRAGTRRVDELSSAQRWSGAVRDGRLRQFDRADSSLGLFRDLSDAGPPTESRHHGENEGEAEMVAIAFACCREMLGRMADRVSASSSPLADTKVGRAPIASVSAANDGAE